MLFESLQYYLNFAAVNLRIDFNVEPVKGSHEAAPSFVHLQIGNSFLPLWLLVSLNQLASRLPALFLVSFVKPG